MKSLRNTLIYELYVRNHTDEGTFSAIHEDLDRIKSLGTDYIWFMPIHEISQENKKGSLGCPYAIKDFKSINPEYGSKEDFKALVDAIHTKGMKVMIDIVFNHTGYNSKYFNENREFFYKNEAGKESNKVGDWTDIIDLDYSNKALWKKQIDVLKYWTTFGIDGYRCDVAPLLPKEFWSEAKKEVNQINPNVIWLAESVHPHFLMELRENGFICHSDAELYEAFDITYDYDVDLFLKDYLKNKISLETYLHQVRMQEYIYPKNYVKLRFLENHDVARAHKIIPNYKKLKQWTAFKYFEKGSMLLYGGQEALDKNLPSLFDKDLVNWDNSKEDYTNLLKTLATIKSNTIFDEGNYKIHTTDKDVIYASYETKKKKIIGIFNVGLEEGSLTIDLPDGQYINELNNHAFKVNDNNLPLTSNPIIFYILKDA